MTNLENNAIWTAYNLREDFNIDINCKTDVNTLVDNLVIKLIYKKLGIGVFGACKTVGRKRLIVIDPEIIYPAKSKFILAHEIGHLLMHQNSHLCREDYFDIWRSVNDQEIEANAFAAELLLPHKIVSETIKKKGITFATIKNLVEKYEVSISMATISAIKVFDDDAIVVCHKNGIKQWSCNSQDCYYNILYNIDPNVENLIIGKKYFRGVIDGNIWVADEIDGLKCEQETMYFNGLDIHLTILKFYKEYE